MTDCNECGVPMDSETHTEELGMCLDCSNRFWSHSEDGHSCSWGCVATAASPREESRL